MDERAEVGTKIHYDLDPSHTALLSVDLQVGFGNEGWERVPAADAAVANFIALADAWRAAGGTVFHLHTTYDADHAPSGNIEQFAPDIREGLGDGSPAAAFYPGVVVDGDVLIRKTTFSGVASSPLLSVLAEHGLDSAIVGGLTTPICVQTTVDGLSMAGIDVAVLADGAASQAFGPFSAEQAHDLAIERMGYIFAQITTTEERIAALQESRVTAL